MVLVKVPHQSCAQDKKISKFFEIWSGPFRVARRFGENAYELVNESNNSVGRFNIISLKRYVMKE